MTATPSTPPSANQREAECIRFGTSKGHLEQKGKLLPVPCTHNGSHKSTANEPPLESAGTVVSFTLPFFGAAGLWVEGYVSGAKQFLWM